MKYLIKKRIYMVVFLLALFGFSGVNFYQNGSGVVHRFVQQIKQRTIDTAALDDRMASNISGRIPMVELVSFTDVLMFKHEFNNSEYVRDKSGYWHYGSFYKEDDPDLYEYACRVRRLQDFATQYGTNVLVVIPPANYDREENEFVTGITANDPRNDVDNMLFYLRRLGIECLDLSASIPGEERSYKESFYKTDHHWTIPAAFDGMCLMVDAINERFGDDWDPWNKYTDIRNYEVKIYQRAMLGSIGRSIGRPLSGLDDYTALLPENGGRFLRRCSNDGETFETHVGTIREALMDFTAVGGGNIYEQTPNALYLDELRTIEHIENFEKPNGRNVFCIRDSYFSPVMVFMAPMCHQIDAVWSMAEGEDVTISTYLREQYEGGINYDYVILEIYPYNIVRQAFRFFKED